jgi:hypothetical protein
MQTDFQLSWEACPVDETYFISNQSNAWYVKFILRPMRFLTVFATMQSKLNERKKRIRLMVLQ